MEQIVIEVDEGTAEEFKKFSSSTRDKLTKTFAMALKKVINDATFANHMRFLDAIGEEAQKNGLTEDILNDLLSDND